MGKIISMAISPSYSQIAFYNNEGKVFIFNTKFDKGRKETNERKDNGSGGCIPRCYKLPWCIYSF